MDEHIWMGRDYKLLCPFIPRPKIPERARDTEEWDEVDCGRFVRIITAFLPLPDHSRYPLSANLYLATWERGGEGRERRERGKGERGERMGRRERFSVQVRQLTCLKQ